jgi:gluconate 2-dehydrogenase gamma chain
LVEILDRRAIPSTARSTPSQVINRRDLIRAVLLAIAAPALGPAFSLAQAVSSGLTAAARGEDGSTSLADPTWKPIFLDIHQSETLIALSEVIIPTTETPGAKEALVNRYLDLLLSVQPAEFQRQFLDALAFVDSESQKQFGNSFRNLTLDNQVWLLTPWAFARKPSHWTARGETGTEPADLGERYFGMLKSLISAAYYGSEIGEKELGWDGEFTHGPYEGCQHNTTHT